jgi:hypothetical protein
MAHMERHRALSLLKLEDPTLPLTAMPILNREVKRPSCWSMVADVIIKGALHQPTKIVEMQKSGATKILGAS